jgi:hypothetical protein
MPLSGGTSTTDNPKVMGTIIGDDKHPASNTRVILVPENYDPLRDTAAIVADTTDALGRFVLPVSHKGVFNIEAVHLVKGTRLLLRGIEVGSGNDSVQVISDTLKQTGSVRVELPDSTDCASGYLYIPGTTVYAFLSETSTQIMLDSVPAATVSAVCYTTTSAIVPTVLRYDVFIQAGDTAVVAMPEWKYSARLYLNTSFSGAGVAGNVLQFPVHVRLNNGNFTFGKALTNGADVRFTKEDGSPLPYEIERWDPVAGLAEVWVKVDTVYGNDTSQFIAMYWGNPAAAGNSNGAAVFDSSSGFEGVWHLAETSGTLAADASHNGFPGIYKGGLPKSEYGPLGISQNIVQPDTDYIDMGDVLNPGTKNISMGIWIKEGGFTLPQALIAKTNGDNPSNTYGYQLAIDTSAFPHFFMAAGGVNWGDDGSFDLSGNVSIVDTTMWHQLFVVIDRSDNGNCKMYVDGIDRTGGYKGNVTSVSDLSNGLNLRIGTESDTNSSYKGAVEEATVSFTTRSADWVKLSFMNQKEPDELVIVGKE